VHKDQPVLQVRETSPTSSIIPESSQPGQTSPIFLTIQRTGHPDRKVPQVRRGYLPSQEQAARSAVDAAELALRQAQQNLDRVIELHAAGFASDVELENATNAYDQAVQALNQANEALNVLLRGSTPEQVRAAEAAVQLARIGLTESQNALGDSTINSPMSGVILERKISEGSVIVSNLAGFGGGDVICTIGDLERMKAYANVDENDIGSVEEGQKCTLNVDAYRDDPFDGTVLKVHPEATIQGGVNAFVTEIEVPNNDRRLMAGMTCEVEIITKTLEDILLVPDRALAQKDDRNFVFVVDGEGKIEAREVEIGETNYESTEVLSGLEEGDQVIVRGVPSDLLDEVVKDEKGGDEEGGPGGRVVIRSSD
jgi:multidrug efflux pump subunit AcrA (membrane-fusion protein)